MIEERRAPGGRRGRTWFLSAVSGIALSRVSCGGCSRRSQEIVVGAGQTLDQIMLYDGETLIVEPGGAVSEADAAAVTDDNSTTPGANITIRNDGIIVSTDEDAIHALELLSI